MERSEIREHPRCGEAYPALRFAPCGLQCRPGFRARQGGPPMSTATLDAKAVLFDVEDVEYVRPGDQPLLARVFRPKGEGPFPALVECHGGAWCLQNRLTEKLRHEAMASNGIVSIALDFRSGNEAPYPASMQDINYA